jgi:uncharacterized SAM-binding protein YcdF (DUF218 family)
MRALRQYLDIGRPPVKADCIFVFAGQPGRKAFGLSLYRSGYADQFVLSVGRFEWRGIAQLGLPDDGGLVALVNRTPPVDRHFFVHLGPQGASCLLVPKRRFGTWTEAVAIIALARERHIQSLLVVSTGSHLRRAISALRAQKGAEALSFHPVAAPLDSATGDGGRDPDDRIGPLVLELGKYILYRLAARASRLR